MLYRIHTQNKNKKFLCQLISKYFDGFSVIEQIGYWQSKKEKSLCIEIVADTASTALKIGQLCKAICGYNRQDAVLIQEIDCKTYLTGSSGNLGEI